MRRKFIKEDAMKIAQEVDAMIVIGGNIVPTPEIV